MIYLGRIEDRAWVTFASRMGENCFCGAKLGTTLRCAVCLGYRTALQNAVDAIRADYARGQCFGDCCGGVDRVVEAVEDLLPNGSQTDPVVPAPSAKPAE